MNEGQPGLLHERVAVGLGIGVAVARQLHHRAHGAHRIHLDLRRRLRHHDRRLQPELPCGKRDALGVVAGAGGDDAAGPFLLAQVRDLVVGAAQLEAEDRLQILALEEHLVRQAPREARREVERRLARHVVDAALEDVVEELGEQPPNITCRRSADWGGPSRAARQRRHARRGPCSRRCREGRRRSATVRGCRVAAPHQRGVHRQAEREQA